jgi:CHAT domain-containing protein
MLALVASNGRSAAPPVSQRWVAQELRRVEKIEAGEARAAVKGDFVLALRLSREVLAGRKALQGERHWDTIAARLVVERWAWLAALPEVGGGKAKLPEGERPFAHPAYWAAFVLVGDPQ